MRLNAPGGAAATTALQSGHEVLGILSGFKWLMEGREAATSRDGIARNCPIAGWRTQDTFSRCLDEVNG